MSVWDLRKNKSRRRDSMNLESIKVKKKTGYEDLHKNELRFNKKLLDFWSWSSSDILSNSLRGVFSEFIVGMELDCIDNTRIEWDAYDLITKDGIKVEIKSSSYLQSWKQNKLSNITFDIRPTNGWDSDTNEYSSECKRQSDVYVFCLLNHKDKDTVDPLNLEQWRFYVLDTNTINKKLGKQKTIVLNSLLKLDPIEVGYGEISRAIEKVLNIS